MACNPINTYLVLDAQTAGGPPARTLSHLGFVRDSSHIYDLAAKSSTLLERFMPVCPTKRAPDAGESGDLSSIFLRLIIFPLGRRPAARPSAGNANRWAAGLSYYFGGILE